MKRSLFLLTLFVFISCKEENLSKTQIVKKAHRVHADFGEIIPESIDGGIKCSSYGYGCVRGFTGMVHGLEVIFVEFKSQKDARNEAIRLDQYYGHNWLFDDVADEPVLEAFFKKHFSASRPLKKIKEKNKKKQAPSKSVK